MPNPWKLSCTIFWVCLWMPLQRPSKRTTERLRCRIIPIKTRTRMPMPRYVKFCRNRNGTGYDIRMIHKGREWPMTMNHRRMPLIFYHTLMHMYSSSLRSNDHSSKRFRRHTRFYPTQSCDPTTICTVRTRMSLQREVLVSA